MHSISFSGQCGVSSISQQAFFASRCSAQDFLEWKNAAVFFFALSDMTSAIVSVVLANLSTLMYVQVFIFRISLI